MGGGWGVGVSRIRSDKCPALHRTHLKLQLTRIEIFVSFKVIRKIFPKLCFQRPHWFFSMIFFMFNKPSVETPCNLNHSYNCVWFSLPDSLHIDSQVVEQSRNEPVKLGGTNQTSSYRSTTIPECSSFSYHTALTKPCLDSSCAVLVSKSVQTILVLIYFFILFSALGALETVFVLRGCCEAFSATFVLLACEISSAP